MGRECNFCSKPNANYVCPKCGFFYCSLDCYRHRTHLECSESFYKDLVLQELSLNTDAKLKEETTSLLEKMNLEEEFLNIEELLNDEDHLDKSSSVFGSSADEYGLIPEERAKFDKLVKNGAIFNLLPAHFWDPWYVKFSQDFLLRTEDYSSDCIVQCQRVKYGSEIDEDGDEDIPSYPTNLPKLKDIITKETSPLIKCAVIQTIFAYCAICRYFVGSHHSSPLEPYDLLAELSSLDNTKVTYPTTGQCLQFASRNLIEKNKMPLCFVEKLYMDTSLIIKSGNRLILRCLVDIVKLCKRAKKKRQIKSAEISRITRKIKFYMSWCVEKEIIYQSELPSIQFEALAFKELTNESKEIKMNEESIHKKLKTNDRKLIEVIESGN